MLHLSSHDVEFKLSTTSQKLLCGNNWIYINKWKERNIKKAISWTIYATTFWKKLKGVRETMAGRGEVGRGGQGNESFQDTNWGN